MFGEKIADLRKERGLSQAELANSLGISRSALSLYEIEKREPDNEILMRIANYFGVSTDYLLGNSVITPNAVQSEKGNAGLAYWIGKTGLDQKAVAKRLGISEDLLEDFMSGALAPPYNILIALSDICEVSTDCLIGLRDKSRDPDLDNVLPFRYNYKIAERIRGLCERENVDQNYLQMLLSLSEKEVYYLIEYGFVPHMSTITTLADYFHVTCDYLLCQVGEQDEKAAMAFRLLNEDNKDIIVGEIKKALLDQRREGTVAAETPLKEAK